ncbi:primary-amine oxidase (plasmid) [Pseudomonas sp. DTU_2021_1001937_2_SI_NGA_ILE_001]|uniref:primary-amine oxidase n=1 Tax=Pseudomonas sp. DTU_2021_1001937_2_SI_NGA_ILE_001 TaxID=3077589 RepID=UPI0028FC1463|nr:primary-amine oxidase [Pseudomonas sp. DTU_2021_1001937_2_SI_NGA_ILE_001]WNW14392.1 primary-amine oxidase [Pseudomonas sp. DTU_2021_1001937_2_SI_NGA_ILE_001]
MLNTTTTFRTLALAAALCTLSGMALAHGGAAEMVPLQTTLEAFGAQVKWDDYAGLFVITKGGAYVKVKPDSHVAQLNGKRLELSVPVVFKGKTAYMAKDFINQVFQSGLDKTFVVESTPHPLNPLSAQEIERAVAVIKASDKHLPDLRFSQISLVEPDKAQVWAFALTGKAVSQPRQASVTLLHGAHVIEARVDLASQKLLSWTPIEGAHGMVLLDDFATVQSVIENSPEYAQAVAKRGITDLKKVIGTPLTVGYFDNKDGLQQDKRLLKVVSYQDVGDGNYWAHPIENLVAVVDLEQKKIIKIEDQGVIPVPLAPRPYNGSDRVQTALKPLQIIEPEGKNYTIKGNSIHWQNWDLHLHLDSRVGPVLSTVSYNDRGTRRKVMYEGNLGGMVVPYGDPDTGWYFKAYLDSGEYGMGTLTSSIQPGKDAPENAVLLDATIADYTGAPMTIPRAMAIFERYAGPEYKHQEMGQPNVSTERRELVVRWISTVGNYDYIFDWVFQPNGTLGINAGATGIEAVKGVKSRTMHDQTAAHDTQYGTLIDHNIVGTTHQHIYNFRLDLDVDGENNSLVEMNPVVLPNDRGGPRTSTMQVKQRTVPDEQQAAQKFDPSTIRLLSNPNKENKLGNPVSYQLIPYAGGTHPVAQGANFGQDEWIYNRLNFMSKQIWVTRYDPNERYPEGLYPNRSAKDTGLAQFTANNQPIDNTDNVVWLTTGTTHVARAEEWPIMPTEWVNVLLKPWNFFDETPTLGLKK